MGRQTLNMIASVERLIVPNWKALTHLLLHLMLKNVAVFCRDGQVFSIKRSSGVHHRMNTAKGCRIHF